MPSPVVPDATAHPHVPFVSAIGAALVPEVAVKVSEPLTRLRVASLSFRVRLYPAELFVVTDTVSLAFDRTPPVVGVKEMATVGPLVIDMTAFTVALIVVFEVWEAADAIAGESVATKAKVATPIAPARCFMFFTIIFPKLDE